MEDNCPHCQGCGNIMIEHNGIQHPTACIHCGGTGKLSIYIQPTVITTYYPDIDKARHALMLLRELARGLADDPGATDAEYVKAGEALEQLTNTIEEAIRGYEL